MLIGINLPYSGDRAANCRPARRRAGRMTFGHSRWRQNIQRDSVQIDVPQVSPNHERAEITPQQWSEADTAKRHTGAETRSSLSSTTTAADAHENSFAFRAATFSNACMQVNFGIRIAVSTSARPIKASRPALVLAPSKSSRTEASANLSGPRRIGCGIQRDQRRRKIGWMASVTRSGKQRSGIGFGRTADRGTTRAAFFEARHIRVGGNQQCIVAFAGGCRRWSYAPEAAARRYMLLPRRASAAHQGARTVAPAWSWRLIAIRPIPAQYLPCPGGGQVHRDS